MKQPAAAAWKDRGVADHGSNLQPAFAFTYIMGHKSGKGTRAHRTERTERHGEKTWDEEGASNLQASRVSGNKFESDRRRNHPDFVMRWCEGAARTRVYVLNGGVLPRRRPAIPITKSPSWICRLKYRSNYPWVSYYGEGYVDDRRHEVQPQRVCSARERAGVFTIFLVEHISRGDYIYASSPSNRWMCSILAGGGKHRKMGG